MIHQIRGYVIPALGLATALFLLLGISWPGFWWPLVVLAPLLGLGLWDLVQTRHNVLRNYPVIGHLRFILEDWGPELRQYLVESNTSGRPFHRDQRSLIYQRAKNVADKKPFGTELNVYNEEYAWISHSMAPKPRAENPVEAFRINVGGSGCKRPYSTSVLNISAMSFGALSPNAILAMNAGARRGGFFHNSGEGGLSRYHRQNGGDLCWQIGTGYFGCRSRDGRFDPDLFTDQARSDQVKLIELKISQGAKPGHGGILPGIKVNAEIAEARGIPVGEDCISPSYHTTFSTPIGLLEFVARLRELSDGKPVGFKLCVGDPVEFYGVCKAMLETGVRPDFITVDGTEGGTGAAPLELSDHVGMPLREGLVLVHNALVGVGVRDEVRVVASGKLVTGFDIAAAMALGADWCNTARGYMFAIGCIQAQLCHTNRCPVGVTTQNPSLYRAIDVTDKAERVYYFHLNPVESLAEVIASAGLERPSEITPRHVMQRLNSTEVRTYDEIYEFLEPGQLLDGKTGPRLQRFWDEASPSQFRPS